MSQFQKSLTFEIGFAIACGCARVLLDRMQPLRQIAIFKVALSKLSKF